MAAWPQGWLIASFALHLMGAIACAIAAGWLIHRVEKPARAEHADVQVRPDRTATIGALCLTALWSAIVAALGPYAYAATLAEAGRNLAWIFVLYRLFANDGRHRSLTPIRPVVVVLAFVEILQIALLLAKMKLAQSASDATLTYEISMLFYIMVSVGALVLLHNLYGGASDVARKVLQWSAIALGAMWAYDLNYFTIGYLSGHLPFEMAALRGLVTALVAILVAFGTASMSAQLRLRPSREVAFRTLSLILIGGYLLVMVMIAQSLAMLGGNFARLTQVGFLFFASVAALLWLPSQRMRRWLRVMTVKHLFQHRYDYRAEWLRFTRTIGQGADSSSSLPERVVKAMADITDSPSGLLLLPDENGAYQLASRWRWPDIDVPAIAMPVQLAELFENDSFILDLDDVRLGSDRYGEAELLPNWLRDADKAWALVPLIHFDRLTGVIILSRPAAPRRLDWEDFDLLRVVGQQLASYLAEQSGHQALMEAARFEDFNRRIAFVMHDIKNLASQMALLARNAERHADNPAFRADMLVTLTNSADKLNGLLARLGRYGTHGSDKREAVDLGEIAALVVKRYASIHPVSVVRKDSGKVLADPEALEQALVHLVHNAVEASDAGLPVYLDISTDGVNGRIDVIDSGCGMSPEFVRNGLFKPFVSSKPAGFGIGAFESREMIRAMGGRLEVETRETLGTRFTVQLPLFAAAEFLSRGPDDYKAEVA
ncbi:PEP-CTERM system histidine kinase PrsK [Altererythrobacter confluentis]|uniref:histidine kinase n=1 Tax=Allopontixanthobacter confluentis TaxID=1849021 RepID=A0A6L7GEM3_9SPHN|nr:XrtA/PEP-CTERM system histidine kinase PrsK [Allopontixanthobacter confluentis]MXP13945.1 PEP-CTERM system histidine kinase PrsK [Allopontixanthobacter confluentis]